ncbi:MAG TPA: Gfo/Idh/MocA family oxidoreductase [Limnochordia bacterium]|nr:Gfo/Idh/MocA family oxidoreductase [Limnochordia bacterium]
MENVLRFGMVGGAVDSFIGNVHRKGATFDDQAQLVAGCFSRNFERTLATGKRWGVAQERLYRSFQEMAEKEAAREDGIDYAIICTPNHSHYAATKAFLEQGIHVVCDKPLTVTVEEAEELVQLAEAKGLLFGVSYAYSQCPAVKQAQLMVRNGDIGQIQVVVAEYPMGWLAAPVELEEGQPMPWRMDPEQSGLSNCVADIGSHVEHTVAYITGLQIEELCARLDYFGGPNRALDTNAHVLLKYGNGGVGNYWCSQVAIGYDNPLRVRIFGTKGTIEWCQEIPNYLLVRKLGEPPQLLARGHSYLYPDAVQMNRLSAGHSEGYFEMFANFYRKYNSALLKHKQGLELTAEDLDFPDGRAGLRGVKFINRCVESSQRGSIWVKFD